MKSRTKSVSYLINLRWNQTEISITNPDDFSQPVIIFQESVSWGRPGFYKGRPTRINYDTAHRDDGPWLDEVFALLRELFDVGIQFRDENRKQTEQAAEKNRKKSRLEHNRKLSQIWTK